MLLFIFISFSFFLHIYFIGQVGITVDTSWPEPKTDSADDKVASELALQFYVSNFDFTFCFNNINIKLFCYAILLRLKQSNLKFFFNRKKKLFKITSIRRYVSCISVHHSKIILNIKNQLINKFKYG